MFRPNVNHLICLTLLLLYSNYSKSFAQKSDTQKSVADSLRKSGLVLKNQGRYQESLYNYKAALIRFERLQQPIDVADCHNKMGVVFQKQSDYDSALFHYYRSLFINDSLNYGLGLLKNYINLSSYYAQNHELKKSISFNNLGRELAIRLEDTGKLSLLFQILGNIYIQSKDPIYLDSAKYYFVQILNIYTDDDYTFGMANVYQNLGLVWEKLNKLDSAKFYYERSVELKKSFGQKAELVPLYRNLGNIERKQGRLSQALGYYTQGLEGAKEYKIKNSIQALASNMAEIYEIQGKYVVAYNLQKLGHQYSDSIFNATNSRQINELNAKYESEKKEKELAQAQIEIERKTAERDGYLISLTVFLALTIVLVLIYQQRQKAIKALAAKEKDLYNKRVNELLLEQEVNSLNAMMDGQELERKRISKELHDRVGSLLTALKFGLDQSKNTEIYTSNTRDLLDEALEETRSLSHSLASGILAKFGLLAAIRDLKDSIESDRTISFDFSHHGFDDRANAAIEIDVYRIVQELISNSLKHGYAKKITVHLAINENCLTLAYEDDGIGFNQEQLSNGIGLKNIEARCKKHGGELVISGKPGYGMTAVLNFEIIEDEKIITSG